MSNDISNYNVSQPFPLNRLDLLDAFLALTGFVLSILFSVLIIIIKSIFHIDSISALLGVSSNFLAVVYEYLAASLIFIIVFAICKRHHLSLRDFGFRPISAIKLIGYVAVSFTITFVAWIIIAPVVVYFFPLVNLEQSQEIFAPGMTIVTQILLIIYAIIIGPLLEEVVFRGIIFPASANRWNLLIGALVSTIIWSLLHFQLNVIIFTLIFGLILSVVYHKSQSLWPCLITHILKNAIAVFFIYAAGLL